MLTVVVLAANVVLGLSGGVAWTAVFGFIPITLSFALVGALIAVRAGNRLGWFFLAGAAVTALSVAANTYAARTPATGLPGAAWAGWIFTVSLGITAPFFFLVPLLFPDGRPPSPRWRPVVWIAVLAGLTDGVASAISDVNFSSNFPHLRDPVELVAPLGTIDNLATTVGPFVFLAGAVSVSVRRWVRHADVLPYCSAVLTHGGHGTVIKALAAGVPLVVAPLGRDQPDNAARVVHAGAGLRVSRKASVADLRQALGRVLDEPRYRSAARRMAATLAAERNDGLVVDELERTALEGATLSHPDPRDPSRR